MAQNLVSEQSNEADAVSKMALDSREWFDNVVLPDIAVPRLNVLVPSKDASAHKHTSKYHGRTHFRCLLVQGRIKLIKSDWLRYVPTAIGRQAGLSIEKAVDHIL